MTLITCFVNKNPPVNNTQFVNTVYLVCNSRLPYNNYDFRFVIQQIVVFIDDIMRHFYFIEYVVYNYDH